MSIVENIKLALSAITGNLLRTSLTLGIIAIGISALIGILTATDGITSKLSSSFSEMGANTFSIKNEGSVRRKGGGRKNTPAVNPPITLFQVNLFKRNFHYPATVSTSSLIDQAAVVRFESKKTNPNVKLFGVDENYLKVSGYALAEGRLITKTEFENGSDVAMVGKDVVSKIFNSGDTVINKLITVGSKKYRIAAILASKGTSQVSSDNQIMIPVVNAKRSFGDDQTSYVINILVENAVAMEQAIDEAIGVMRVARKNELSNENDFEIVKSDKLASQIIDNLSYVRMATFVIGILTLLGAGVGLMNIMLVSVNERTREIGTSKALGASKKVIRIQFLTESITLCFLGGIIGIVLGVLLGNLVSVFIEAGFIMPWKWISVGLFFTFFVGLFAGIYPAYKASNLDPVEALRYE